MNKGWRIRALVLLWCWLFCAVSARADTALDQAEFRPVQWSPGWKAQSGPILVAGDGENLWASQPAFLNTKAGFQLYVHPVNRLYNDQPLWVVVPNGGAT